MKIKNGKLYIVATPIGNLGDITLRAIETLKLVDLIICEDSRVTSKLLKYLNIKKSIYVYNDHSDENIRRKVLLSLGEGKNIALVSDAGTPLISDPGYKLIQEIQKLDFEVTTIPGACSVIAALTISGMPTDKFTFVGFVPSKKNAKDRFLEELCSNKSTVVFFETSNRLESTLETINNIVPTAEVAVIKEITKIYEQVIRGRAAEVLQYFSDNIEKLRGEIVVVISPNKGNEESNVEEIECQLRELLLKMSVKDTVDLLSNQHNVKKNTIYKLALKIKNCN